MNAGQLLAHFDRISEAPEAVNRLRRFIFDLAVRGKLVEQDPKDEPASELLERIQSEKAQIVKEGKPKKAATGSAGGGIDGPFSLPPSWAWVCLGDIAQYGLSDKVNSNREIAVNTWVLDLEDIERGTSRLIERTLSTARPFRSTKTIFERGDVLFGKLRPYLNKVLVADQDGVCTTEIIPIRGYCGMVPEYVRLVLKSPLTMARVDRLMYGMKMPRLGTEDAVALSFPLSPLAEQQRIVAKVDELMALCDRLAATQSERESRRDRLVGASLHRLNNGADDESFREHFRFHLRHLPRLSTRPEHIQQLRQTILSLAFQGSLTRRSNKDGFGIDLVSEVYGQCGAGGPGKARMGKAKRSATLECDPAFSAPETWGWIQLQFLCEQIGDIDHKMPRAVPVGVPFLSAKDLKDSGELDFSDPKYISEEDFTRLSRKILPRRGDIIYSRIGAKLGKARLVEVDTRFLISYSCCLIRPKHQFVEKRFLQIFLDSHLALSQAHSGVQSIGVPDLGLGEIKAYRIPMPPLAEQRRIVAKVDELMVLCGKLETELSTTQIERDRLLEAVLHEALASTSSPSMQLLYGTEEKCVMGHDPTVESPVPLMQNRA